MKPIEQPMMANHMCVFWHRPDERIEPMWDMLGIHRLMWRGGKSPYVIFRCSSAAFEWVQNIDQGHIEIRHVPIGLLDNPYAGELVCTIKNIRLTEAWVNKISRLEFEIEPIYFHIAAECDIDWKLFPIFEVSERGKGVRHEPNNNIDSGV